MISANSAVKLSASKLSMEDRIPYLVESQILHHACQGMRSFRIGGRYEWLMLVGTYVIKRGYSAKYLTLGYRGIQALEISW